MPLPGEQAKDAGERRPTGRMVKLRTMQRHIREAREARDPMLRVWNTIYDHYKSDPTTAYDVDGEFMLQANLAYAWYESMWPSLLFRNPVFHAEPTTEAGESSAKTVSQVVTGELRGIRFKRQLRRAGYDFLLYALGILTYGYYDGGLLPQGASDSGSEVLDEKRNSDLPYGFENRRLFVRAIRPHRFLIDPSASSLDEAMWCGIEYDRDVAAVKKDPQYENTSELNADVIALPRGMSEEEYRDRYSEAPDRTMVRLVQYYDITDRKVYVVNSGHERILSEREFTLPVKRFPVQVARASDDEDDFYCQPPMAAWLNLVEEHNIAISRRLNHTSRHYRRYGYDTDRVSQEAADKLCEPCDAAIPVKGGDARTAIAPIQDAPVSADSYAFTRESLDLWRFISGMSELDLGAMRPGERPAAEIQRMAAGANARRGGLGERLQSMLEDFASDVRSIMERYYDEERAVRITGDYGETEWVRYTGADLSGEYLFECRISDMQIKTPDSAKQEAAEILQMFAPFSQFGSPMPAVDLVPLIQRFGREVGARELRFFPQSNPPMDPTEEWYTICRKGVALQPNQLDDHQYHVFMHETQLMHPETLKSDACVARLRSHLEQHRSMLLAQTMAQQPSPAAAPGGRPGPPDGASNNPGGGAGIFATGGGAESPDQLGGSTGENLQALLRGNRAGAY